MMNDNHVALVRQPQPALSPRPPADHLAELLDEVLTTKAWTQALALCRKTLTAGGTIFLIGNGLSALDAQRIGCLMQTMALHRGGPRVRTLSLGLDAPLLTAIANDDGAHRLFAAQIELMGRSKDLLIALSTSGNSPNVLEAVTSAQSLGMAALGFTGQGGGHLAFACDACVTVPSQDAALVQDAHVLLGRTLVNALQD